MVDRIVLVTGGSRGVGRGIAEELADQGATVFVTGRTVERADLGPGCIPIACDHTDDEQVRRAFDRVLSEGKRLDVLVNNVWGGYERMVEQGQFTWAVPFWHQPLWRWDAMFGAGVRAHYVASALAADHMVERHAGLIVNVSFWAAQKHVANVPYGVSKAATDKLTADAAAELRPYGVAVVSVYPGLVRTEKVMEAAAYLDMTNSESPRFMGRVVSALARDPAIMEKSGAVLVAATCAIEYGCTDVDGRQPIPLTIDDV